ncbi:Acetyl-coenzyme A synthetase [Phytophthora palmivora]|uniref:acetate--CoA ligase n=1 Tax=Phytophthora palmivora TaxID=4796 RepID=A0A2P4XSR2_9STRA|nr:Acetyl-coenzyme A synthetase [Phytophthora palmivora]
MGTAQRNARLKLLELLEQAQEEQEKWTYNKRNLTADALRDRVVDAKTQWVFTADEGRRGGISVQLSNLREREYGTHAKPTTFMFVFKRTHNPEVNMNPAIDVDMDAELLLHPGYLLYAMMTAKYAFDIHDDDIFASRPMYPDHGRYWDLVQRPKVTKFYTAPTAIRALMARGDDKIRDYDLSSLKVLGSVGEPINPEAWKWYYEVVGNRQCYIVDTYWQTETGGHIGVGMPGATPMKPGSCSKPFFGIDFVVTDENGNEIEGNEGQLCIRSPWPGMARTVYGDHNRYLQVYTASHKGLYFTGDGCRRDKDGYYFITGRIDDVLCTSGHRIGTAELESTLVGHSAVAEAAVIGIPHRDGSGAAQDSKW